MVKLYSIYAGCTILCQAFDIIVTCIAYHAQTFYSIQNCTKGDFELNYPYIGIVTALIVIFIRVIINAQ